jgi:hypothetical protein
MNARFRSGFIHVLHRIPGFRRCFCLKKLRGTHKHLGESMMGATGGLTGENKFHKDHPNCKQICYTKPTHNVTKCNDNNNEEDDLDEEDDVIHGTELSHFRCPSYFFQFLSYCKISCFFLLFFTVIKSLASYFILFQSRISFVILLENKVKCY